jgi:hypothetical protein
MVLVKRAMVPLWACVCLLAVLKLYKLQYIMDQTIGNALCCKTDKFKELLQMAADVHRFQVRSASGFPGPPWAANASQMPLRCPHPQSQKKHCLGSCDGVIKICFQFSIFLQNDMCVLVWPY